MELHERQPRPPSSARNVEENSRTLADLREMAQKHGQITRNKVIEDLLRSTIKNILSSSISPAEILKIGHDYSIILRALSPPLSLHSITSLWTRPLQHLLQLPIEFITSLSIVQTQCFEGCFVPFVSENTQKVNVRKMAMVSFKVLVANLRAGDAPLHSYLVKTVVRILRRLLTCFNMEDFFQAIFFDNEESLGEKKDWREVVDLLCSVPTRIANYLVIMEMRPGEELADDADFFYDKLYFKYLSERFEVMIWDAHNSSPQFTSIDTLAYAASNFLEKLCRLGCTQPAIESFYSRVRSRFLTSASEPILYMQAWKLVFDNLSQSSLERFITALFSHLSDLYPSNKYISPTQRSKREIRKIARWLRSWIGPFAKKPSMTGDEVILRSIIIRRIILGGQVYGFGSLRIATCLLSDFPMEEAENNGLLEDAKLIAEAWIDPVFIGHASLEQQKYLTGALLLVTGYLSQTQLASIFQNGPMLRGMTFYLDSTAEDIRKLGMMTAEIISKKSNPNGTALDFGLDWSDEDMVALAELVNAQDGIVSVDEREEFQEVAEDNIEGVVDTVHTGIADKDLASQENIEELEDDPDSIVELHYANEDNGDDEAFSDATSEDSLVPYPMEDEDEDVKESQRGKPKAKRIKKPVYIGELLVYLRAHEDPDRLELGLREAEGLIRQKAGVGTELGELAVELARCIIGLQDNYDFEEFSSCRQAALIALIVSAPEIAVPYIVEQFFAKEYSLGQRFVILSGLVAGAKELAGVDSHLSSRTKSFDRSKPPQTIDYLASQIQDLTLQSQRNPLADSLHEVSELRGGKTRRFHAQRPLNTAQKNRFAKYARTFFFPLLAGWWQKMCTGAMGYHPMQEPVLLERFITALGILLHCSTNTPHINQMCREYIDFALSLRHVRHVGSLAALFFGILVTINTLSSQTLVNSFGKEVVECKDWALEALETTREERVREVCASVLIRLQRVMEEYERVLVGELLPVS
ncbi:uncharacterized protein VTP21DRAFT_8953 [Calcarisporiella thermophila]|uniref:uncharacterized protein n=1 Tax=Calcarisporiella thermophila TaxID=911321 RepID=UPI0037437BE4